MRALHRLAATPTCVSCLLSWNFLAVCLPPLPVSSPLLHGCKHREDKVGAHAGKFSAHAVISGKKVQQRHTCWQKRPGQLRNSYSCNARTGWHPIGYIGLKSIPISGC
eukprot:1153275-Pelagomonas_calceolata.AAC.4